MPNEADLLHQAHDLNHIEIDENGWMHGPGVSTIPSDRHQSLWPGETNILGIVWHYTDTRSAGAANLAERIAGPVDGGRAASWHLCIDRAGLAAQSVSTLMGSWHAGGATAARFTPAGVRVNGHRRWTLQPSTNHGMPGANSLFFGIELENVGEVRLVGNEWLGWPFRRGSPYGDPIVVPADEVEGTPSGHHVYTALQVQTARRVVAALAGAYGLIRENCSWSHQQIDPTNRTDPGPLWMAALPGILGGVFGSAS